MLKWHKLHKLEDKHRRIAPRINRAPTNQQIKDIQPYCSWEKVLYVPEEIQMTKENMKKGRGLTNKKYN